MNRHLKDILSTSSTPVDPEKLIAYLNQELPPQEAQALEEKLAADEFDQAALEGLETVQNKRGLDTISQQLNRELQKKVKKRNQALKKQNLNQPPLTLIVVLILLLLIVLAYWVITRLLST